MVRYADDYSFSWQCGLPKLVSPQEHLLGILFIETGMYFINKEELEREGGKELALEEYDTRKGEMEIWRVNKKDQKGTRKQKKNKSGEHDSA